MKIEHSLRKLTLLGFLILAAGALGAQVAAAVSSEQVLYSFCPQTTCADGANPEGSLIMDAAGSLYGSAGGGGTAHGVAFELTPTDTGWMETVLYTFCSQTNCADGEEPAGPLVMDGAGNLYGTTFYGGTSPIGGVVFKLTPTDSGWVETVLYSFCSQTNCADGTNPQGGVIMDAAGNLYGTATGGGSSLQAGVAFELTPTDTGWTETVLYSFCSQTNCADGRNPRAGVIMDTAGNLYGTTNQGGASNGGIVFALTPTGSVWVETVLYSFCSQTNCADGAGPFAGLIIDGMGNLYGTTVNGGRFRKGVVFALNASPTASAGGQGVARSTSK
jgi:uncharacterized repeat protein (TIGR03803 family)